jgi:hypothetical protein
MQCQFPFTTKQKNSKQKEQKKGQIKQLTIAKWDVTTEKFQLSLTQIFSKNHIPPKFSREPHSNLSRGVEIKNHIPFFICT